MATFSQEINVKRLVDDRPFGSLQAQVFLFCAIAILLDGMDSITIGLTATSIAQTLHIKMSAFGLVFGMGQAGVMIGALAFGLLADRVGRKSMVIVSTLLFGVFTFLTAHSGTYAILLGCRFIAGLGLGGATPNAVALMAEYAPKRSQAAVVAALWASFPLGGTLVGLISSYMLPHFGWRSIYYVGGITPILLCVALWFALPESAGFLVARNCNPKRIRKVIRKLAPDLQINSETRFSVDEEKMPGVPVKHLFTQHRAVTTLLLWVAMFCAFLILIFTISWIPPLLKTSGLPVTLIGFAIALHSLGSVVGSGVVGYSMDRVGTYSVLITTFCLAAIFTGMLGYFMASFGEMAIVILLAGFFAGASQSGAIALAARTYPIAIRSTGVGWAIASGRLGAVVGPVFGGVMVAWGWRVQHILLSIAVPAVIGAIAVLLLLWKAVVDAARERRNAGMSSVTCAASSRS